MIVLTKSRYCGTELHIYELATVCVCSQNHSLNGDNIAYIVLDLKPNARTNDFPLLTIVHQFIHHRCWKRGDMRWAKHTL
ncbi:MAG: hypothetical protein C0485_08755 [Pirellula sp.]|nr:hypothetical protein [Pirellula sp.]